MPAFFIDTNVFLDLILKREPAYQHSLSFFELSVQQEFILFTSAITIADLNYLLYRQIRNRKEVIQILEKILSGIEIICTPKAAFDSALQSQFQDMEDAFQYYTAVTQSAITAFVTNNKKDFKPALLPVMNAEEALKKFA